MLGPRSPRPYRAPKGAPPGAGSPRTRPWWKHDCHTQGPSIPSSRTGPALQKTAAGNIPPSHSPPPGAESPLAKRNAALKNEKFPSQEPAEGSSINAQVCPCGHHPSERALRPVIGGQRRFHQPERNWVTGCVKPKAFCSTLARLSRGGES